MKYLPFVAIVVAVTGSVTVALIITKDAGSLFGLFGLALAFIAAPDKRRDLWGIK